jgi:opacity protein-like surface antigen
MKKLTSILMVAAAATAAQAEGTSATGFYAGLNAGIANTQAKYTAKSAGTLDAGGATQNFTSQTGKMGALFGVFAGYGMSFAQGAYAGFEVYGGLDTTKFDAYNDSATTKTGFPKVTLKRTNFYGFAPRIGYMITPSTLAYVRLGVEGGKWKMDVTPNQQIDPSLYGPAGNGTDANQIAAMKKTTSASKNSFSFVPGLGLEVFLNKNLFLRAEYTYLFGPKVTVNQDTSYYRSSSYINGTSLKHEAKITQHAFKLGVGYKF